MAHMSLATVQQKANILLLIFNGFVHVKWASPKYCSLSTSSRLSVLAGFRTFFFSEDWTKFFSFSVIGDIDQVLATAEKVKRKNSR